MPACEPASGHRAARTVLRFFSGALFALLFLGFFPMATPPAYALPMALAGVHPIPAFARKYDMPCSVCHDSWPRLSPFGQAFKDNGYQLGNERDSPIYQHPSYWPITFRITPGWHRESTNRVAVDGPTPGSTVENKITTDGFDWSGLDFHTAGTLAKKYIVLRPAFGGQHGRFPLRSGLCAVGQSLWQLMAERQGRKIRAR